MTGPATTSPVRLLIVGAGGRGSTYADYTLAHPGEGVVVGVAEPDAGRRQALAHRHRIPAANVYPDWQSALAAPALPTPP